MCNSPPPAGHKVMPASGRLVAEALESLRVCAADVWLKCATANLFGKLSGFMRDELNFQYRNILAHLLREIRHIYGSILSQKYP